MKLKPLDRQIPTFFGIRHSIFFKMLAIFNLLSYVIGMALTVQDIFASLPALQRNPPESYKVALRIFSWAYTFFPGLTFNLLLDIWLYFRSDDPGIRFLQFYWIYHSAHSTVAIMIYYISNAIILASPTGWGSLPKAPLFLFNLLLCYLIYRLYTCYVVYKYMQLIKFDKEMKSAYRSLTLEETDNFKKGMSVLPHSTLNLTENFELQALQEKYHREEFEIPMDSLDFSECVTLGCGEYGCVYRAKLIQKDKSFKHVAVKTVDPQLTDINKFLALLKEAKVMTCIGKHENVVGLIGLCTEEIRDRELYIVCELCELGNLRSHLRTNRNTFRDLFSLKCGIQIEECTTVNSISSVNLVLWSYQIANGMEFLASNRIVHGDLAARNVLLTNTNCAKITDFGLSRRLYNYSIYKKRSGSPLPWRSLALECLLDMNFSTRSDVYAFGICCWEIFTLGERPWPQYSEFTSSFVTNLREGYIPAKPISCNDKLYSIMCGCWNQDPYKRMTFPELKKAFQQVLLEIV